mmetsp:Transcript_15356/g.16102  ORF Transcript_15356/g.16102 Transcript_15356/m.16102 type:complete len:85 (-) Transcript_15356:371-625(-)
MGGKVMYEEHFPPGRRRFKWIIKSDGRLNNKSRFEAVLLKDFFELSSVQHFGQLYPFPVSSFNCSRDVYSLKQSNKLISLDFDF